MQVIENVKNDSEKDYYLLFIKNKIQDFKGKNNFAEIFVSTIFVELIADSYEQNSKNKRIRFKEDTVFCYFLSTYYLHQQTLKLK